MFPLDFITQLVNLGAINPDNTNRQAEIDYWSSLPDDSPEWADFRSAAQGYINQQVDAGLINPEGDPEAEKSYYASLLDDPGAADWTSFFAAVREGSAAGLDTDPGAAPEGAEGDALGIMGGGTLTQVTRPGQDDTFFQVYTTPTGTQVAFQFTDAQLTAAFGAGWATSMNITQMTETMFNNNVTDLGDVAQMIGQEGTFSLFWEDAVRAGASAAGLGDPSVAGLLAADADVQDILLQSALGNWTDPQLQAALRQTSLWTETLYPGIESFYALGAANPEQAWNNYMSSVSTSLELMGVQRDADGSFRSTVGDLLDDNVSALALSELAPTFVRASQNEEFFGVFQEYAQAQLGINVTFGDWFDVLDGTAIPQLQQLAENTMLQYESNQQGLGLDFGTITRIGEGTDLTQAGADQLFSGIGQELLTLDRAILENQYGLNRDDIISALAGITPESGRSLEEIKRRGRQAAQEQGSRDNLRQARLYTGFTESGTPTKPGLAPLAPTAG